MEIHFFFQYHTLKGLSIKDSIFRGGNATIELVCRHEDDNRKYVKVKIVSKHSQIGDCVVKRDDPAKRFAIIKKDKNGLLLIDMGTNQTVGVHNEDFKYYKRPGNTFTVYLSKSQQRWRFCYKTTIGASHLEKGEYYTSTTVVHPKLQERLSNEYSQIAVKGTFEDVYVPNAHVFQHHVNSEHRVNKKNFIHELCGDESLPFIDEETLSAWAEKSGLRIALSDCLTKSGRTHKILQSIDHTLNSELKVVGKTHTGEEYDYMHDGKTFTFHISSLGNISKRDIQVPDIRHTYLITTNEEMTPWGMPREYVPAGILLIKPFEYKKQASSLVTNPQGPTWRDGKSFDIGGTQMGEYYFFGDVASGMFPVSNMKMFNELHAPRHV